MSATVTYVGESSRRVSKRLYFASPDTDGVWRGQPESEGLWRKPEDFGEANVRPPNRIEIRAHETPDLRSRYELRKSLSLSPTQFLLLGVKSPSVTGLVARNQKTLIDGPRGQLVLDIEGLIIEGDVVERDLELPDVLFSLFENCGLECLIADCVIHLSSTHGIRDRREIRCHIEWQLKTPLTIAEQKRVAAYINSKLGGDYADTKIYESARLFFSGPTELISRHFVDGKGFVPRDHKPPPVLRVRYVDRGLPEIELPIEALRGAPKAVPDLKRPTTAKAIGKLVPGNVHNYMVRRTMAAVQSTPWHRLTAEKERLRQELAAGVMALDDPEKLEARLAHVTGAAFETSWEGAIKKRYTWGDWHNRPLVTPDERDMLDVATARLTLASHIESAAREAYGLSTSGNVVPRHTLITALPGLGKSQLSVEAVTTPRCTVNITRYLTPNIKLSDELMHRHHLYSHLNPDYDGLVRHHIGRDQVCTHKVLGPAGTQLAKVGRSPRMACDHCPLRLERPDPEDPTKTLPPCPWPAQQDDTGAGLIFGQHAHATSSMRRTKSGTEGAPNFTIVDESPIGTLLAPNKLPRHIKALRRSNLNATIRGHLDGTADLRAYRNEVLTALELTKGALEVNRISHWAQTVTLKKATDNAPAETGPLVDAALKTEAWAASIYDKQLKAALADMTERQAKGVSDLSPKRQFQRNIRQLETSGFFVALYRAIKATLAVNAIRANPKAPRTPRKTVSGVYASKGLVSVHTRQQLPDCILSGHALWLDGTPDPDIWLKFFGDAHFDPIEPIIRVKPGHYHLTQYPDRPYGRNFWRDKAHLERLYRLILERAAHHRPGQILVVVQKATEALLLAKPLPDNVAVHHFKAIRGLDGFKDCPCVIVAGRPMLDQRELENLTEALHFDDPDMEEVKSGEGRYHAAARTLNTVRGPVTINSECHPDSRAEALRVQLVDKEVVQAIHRLRLFDRTEANPAEIHVFGQADTGLVVHEMANWTDAERSPAEAMLSSGVYSTKEELVARGAMGVLFGCASSTVRLVVGALKCADLLCKYKKTEDEQGVLVKGNRHISEHMQPEWQTYSVKFRGSAYAARVQVDTARWQDAAQAIEYELRVKVTSLSLVHREQLDSAA